MHTGNVDWLRDVNTRFSQDLRGKKLLELGALNINGSARSYLEVGRWIGIDQIAGADVDIVCKAAETKFEIAEFDLILCTSMLEHDPNWSASISWNVQWLRPGGLFLLSWGAEGNQWHLPEPWAAVPIAEVKQWIARDNRLVIVEECWEYARYTADCAGCYDMVLRRQTEI